MTPHCYPPPQSDARDAVSLREHSPYLIGERLGLPSRVGRESGVTYVNGGVFFARGTPAVARLFEDAWTLAAQVR